MTFLREERRAIRFSDLLNRGRSRSRVLAFTCENKSKVPLDSVKECFKRLDWLPPSDLRSFLNLPVLSEGNSLLILEVRLRSGRWIRQRTSLRLSCCDAGESSAVVACAWTRRNASSCDETLPSRVFGVGLARTLDSDRASADGDDRHDCVAGDVGSSASTIQVDPLS